MTHAEHLAERRGYQRGYSNSCKPRWPEHRPPEPPNEIVAGIIRTTRALRDGVDGYLATIDPDDEIEKQLGPLVDAVDASLIAVSNWLVSPEADLASHRGGEGE